MSPEAFVKVIRPIMIMVLFVLMVGCAGSSVATPTLTLQLADGGRGETKGEEGVIDQVVFMVPLGPDVPADVVVDTAQIEEMLRSDFLSRFPNVELVSIAAEEGFLVIAFSGSASQELCQQVFDTFGATPDCDVAVQAGPAAAAPTEGNPRPTADAAAIQLAVEKVLPSVVVIRGDSGGGTGFIYTSDGYILTNRHVVELSSDFEVLLYDGRSFSAELTGIVEETGFGGPDLAVLKINATGLPAVELGDSSDLQFGEPISIIGHPAGYAYWLATSGYFDRSVGTDIVSTAASSEGASGAPMINEKGQVVGLLWGELGSVSALPEPAIPADTVQVIWTWDEFQKLRTHSSWGVAINTAVQLAEAIITSGGNVDRTAVFEGVDYRLEGNVLEVVSPGFVEAETINNFYLEGLAEKVVNASFSDGQVILTFNQAPSPQALEAVLTMFKEMNATSVDTPSLENYSTRIAGAQDGPFTSHPDSGMARAAAEQNVASVVFLRTPSGQGTGFFISSDGYILTNSHVIKEPGVAAEIEVTLYDGRILSGRIVGIDEDQSPDVGVIKVDGTGFPAVNIGNSADLQLGDSVFMIGHPGGYGYWVVTGGEILDLRGGASGIDSTAATQQGGSGSPIFDLNGDVVGLLWGREGGEVAQPERLITEIIWTWTEFWALAVDSQFSTGVAIETAMARANEIIAAQGNVP